jgi:hypothetical protein
MRYCKFLLCIHNTKFMCLFCFFVQLKFKKGDIITITQKEEGGWWEGTLGSVPHSFLFECNQHESRDYYKVPVLFRCVVLRASLLAYRILGVSEFTSAVR